MVSLRQAASPSRCHLSRTCCAVRPPTSTPSTRVPRRVVPRAAAAAQTAMYAAASTPTAMPAIRPAVRPGDRGFFSFCKGFWLVCSMDAPPCFCITAPMRVLTVYYNPGGKKLQSGNNQQLPDTLSIFPEARLGMRMVSRISRSVSCRSHPASTPAWRIRCSPRSTLLRNSRTSLMM